MGREIKAIEVRQLAIIDVARFQDHDAPAGLDWSYPEDLDAITIHFEFDDETLALVEVTDESRIVLAEYGYEDLDRIPDGPFGDSHSGTVEVVETSRGYAVLFDSAAEINAAYADR